jgi:3-methyladenine DNA glycosylase AlkD
MARPAKNVSEKPPRTAAQLKTAAAAAVSALRSKSSSQVRAGMTRFGLPPDRALGVPMKQIQALAKRLGPDHALADPLWDTGVYEARLLVAYVGEPSRLTVAQMDRWCADFDNWAVVDTLCFTLFNESPHAWGRVAAWVKKKNEFEKRAGFVLMACLSGPRRNAEDAVFLRWLPVIERDAADERNFVKKGVSWALRMIGRRNAALHEAALAVARRLADSPVASARWVGKDALRDLTKPAVIARIGAAGTKARKRKRLD